MGESDACSCICYSPVSYTHLAVAVVDLVLDDLRGEAGERLLARLEAPVLEAHLDGAVARCAAAAGEGQAALLGLVRARAADDLRVEPVAYTHLG